MPKPSSRQPVIPVKRFMDRVTKTVHRDERKPFNAPSRRRRGVVGGGTGGIVPARAPAGGIAAGDMGSPSNGTVTLCFPAGGTGPGLSSSGGRTVTAYNVYTSSVPGNAIIWITHFKGHWYIVNGNCGAST